ncbi:uncharacterized protein [Diabrotica undecimpunctata]|uniref:uncharacterized protein n=1 Tax=Diabrotica undecimpunctata TaxID=50387 RepID=UPI003B63F573
MNNDIFTKWIRTRVIPNLEKPSLILMDNAPYHSVFLEKQSTTPSKKDKIVTWLIINNIQFDPKFIKPKLLQVAKMNKKENVYVIDEVLREHGHEVLRLPPYHCEFNAIELIWANCKSYYNKHIGRDGYSDSAVIKMWKEALNQCNGDIWEKCVRHTHEIIQKWYIQEQNIVDIDIQPIIINPEDSSDSESEGNI